ncbi:MAG: 2-amino-4-hydroxy-6-hydroxymethyldihydropteridine diphosphokinase [Verrucomicrobiales bacterium]
MRTGIALGSNLGDRLAILRSAVQAVQSLNDRPIRVSALYESVPVGCAPGDPLFLNGVMEIDWIDQPQQLLGRLQELEAAAGRPTEHVKNAPRPLDLDILYWGHERIIQEDLVLPHPRWYLRSFVYVPLVEIAEDWVKQETSDPEFVPPTDGLELFAAAGWHR